MATNRSTASIDEATRQLLRGRPALLRHILWAGTAGTRRQRKVAVNAHLRAIRVELAALTPSRAELELLSGIGRVGRLVAAGATPLDAVEMLLKPESSEEYVQRNQTAMEDLEKRILSPEYQARFSAIQEVQDPVKRAQLSAELKRETFASIDMEAVHRTIRARNRQWQKEGILPPDAKV